MDTKTPPFQIHRSLGKGGIGEAFLATQSATGRLGVLKKVPADAFAKKVASLKKEFATLSRLAHPNIARVFEFGGDAGSVFFFEEYVDGADIFQSASAADYNQILSCLVQVLRALHYLHTQGFLHGDLKPENILAVRGVPLFQEDAVKLIDFGLAKHLGDIRADARPSGTIHFMAPEMLSGKPYDARADLFALGVCLYRMLAGRYPFEEERGNMSRLLNAQLKNTPPEPKDFRADLSKGLNDLTMKLMSKSPADRYPDAQKVLEALNAAEGEHFPLWTPAELKTALHDGPFIGRETELKGWEKAHREGRTSFAVTGLEGIGKSRFVREFKIRLQLDGRETESLTFREGEGDGALKLPPWSASQTAEFLKNRLRLSALPETLLAAACSAGEGNPLKVITLVDFWLADGAFRIEDGSCFVDEARIDPFLTFDRIMEKRLEVLESKRREILFLCAFSGAPLSDDLLRRITGGTARDTEALLESLERDGWLVRELDQGSYAFRVEGARRVELLKELVGPSSLEELFVLVRETHHAGDFRRARVHLEGLLGQFPDEIERADASFRRRLYEKASLIYLETDALDRADDFTKRLLAMPGGTHEDSGKAYNRLGWIAYRRGLYDDARKSFLMAEKAWEHSGDAQGVASAANFLGMALQAQKNFDQALGHYARALSLLPDGDEWQAMMRMNMALCAQEAERFGESLEAYEKALTESEHSKDKRIRAAVLANLSNLYLYLGRLDRAGRLAHDSLKFAIENGLEGLEGQNYLFLAHLADKEGNVADFRNYVEKAKAIFSRSGTAAEKARAGLYEAFFALTEGDEPRCRSVLGQLRKDFAGERGVMAQCDVVEGKLALKTDPPDAERGDAPLERARVYYESRKDDSNLWEVLNALGQLHRYDRPKDALEYFKRTLEIIDRVSEKIPESCREAFYRDRKREKILQTLEQLNLKSVKPSTGGTQHAERRT